MTTQEAVKTAREAIADCFRSDAVAESIIRCEGLTFALAVKVGKDGDLREARAMLKARLVKELAAVEERGMVAIQEGRI